MELSTLIGKQILSPTGEKFGYTKSAYFTRDFNKLSSLSCINEEEEEFFLPARAIYAADDVIIAGNARLESPTGRPFPVGLPAYSNTGEYLGAVSDLLCKEGERSVFIVMKDGIRNSYASDCVSAGETLIVYPTPREKKPAPSRAPRTVRQKTKPIAPVLPDAAQANRKPNDFTFNRTNLLGRQVKRSVFDGYGRPIALAGDRITPAVLTAARKENRLLQLTVNTLTTAF